MLWLGCGTSVPNTLEVWFYVVLQSFVGSGTWILGIRAKGFEVMDL